MEQFKIKRGLFRLGRATTEELAAFAAVKVSTVRNYLNTRPDVCERISEAPRGGRGRPPTIWKLTAAGREILRSELSRVFGSAEFDGERATARTRLQDRLADVSDCLDELDAHRTERSDEERRYLEAQITALATTVGKLRTSDADMGVEAVLIHNLHARVGALSASGLPAPQSGLDGPENLLAQVPTAYRSESEGLTRTGRWIAAGDLGVRSGRSLAAFYDPFSKPASLPAPRFGLDEAEAVLIPGFPVVDWTTEGIPALISQGMLGDDEGMERRRLDDAWRVLHEVGRWLDRIPVALRVGPYGRFIELIEMVSLHERAAEAADPAAQVADLLTRLPDDGAVFLETIPGAPKPPFADWWIQMTWAVWSLLGNGLWRQTAVPSLQSADWQRAFAARSLILRDFGGKTAERAGVVLSTPPLARVATGLLEHVDLFVLRRGRAGPSPYGIRTDFSGQRSEAPESDLRFDLAAHPLVVWEIVLNLGFSSPIGGVRGLGVSFKERRVLEATLSFDGLGSGNPKISSAHGARANKDLGPDGRYCPLCYSRNCFGRVRI